MFSNPWNLLLWVLLFMVTSCGASSTTPLAQTRVEPPMDDSYQHNAWESSPDIPVDDSLGALAERDVAQQTGRLEIDDSATLKSVVEGLESTPVQYLCQADLLEPGAVSGENAIQIVFVYPQMTERDYLSVQVLVAGQAVDYQATFSTVGEESWWTLPVIRGIAPVVITQWAAIRTPAQERFTVAWSHAASSETEVVCEEMPWVSEL